MLSRFITKLTTKENDKLIADKIKNRIIGQVQVVDIVVNSILASKLPAE